MGKCVRLILVLFLMILWVWYLEGVCEIFSEMLGKFFNVVLRVGFSGVDNGIELECSRCKVLCLFLLMVCVCVMVWFRLSRMCWLCL